MKKKIIGALCLVGMFLLISVLEPSVYSIKVSTPEIKKFEPVELTNITLKDDAFHKTYNFFHIETWYFDAIFDNNYSMALCVTVIQRGSFAIAATALNLYEDTNWIKHKGKLNPFRRFSGSEEKPILKICNKTIITGDIDKVTNSWIYNVSLATDKQAVDLHYTSVTKGWKVDIRGGWWLAIPRLNVTGTISLNGKEITVSGEGYHDHNWFHTYTPLIQKGWHFGRIAGDTLCVTWAKVMKTRFKGEIIAILNQGQTAPLMLNPNDFKITITEYMYDHGRFIPKNFSIEIKNDRLFVDVKMETLNVRHFRRLFLNYWRYHVRAVGTITLDGFTEKIDNIEISELMKFF